MKKRMFVFLIVAALTILTAIPVAANRGNGGLGTVYVSSQDLYFDTFVSAKELPMKGPFQKLETETGEDYSETEYGPGDQGYVGGRWWIDDGDVEGVMEETDTFLLCPLLGPGRSTP